MVRSSLLASLALVLGTAAAVADWPRYRGATGMGIAVDADLPLNWGGKDAANVLWKAPLPGTTAKGKPDHNQSSPIISKDRVLVTSAYWPEGKAQTEFPEQHVTCYRLADGKQLWDTVVPPGPLKLTDLRGGYAAPTPCTDGDRVYVLFGSSTLAALDLDGKIVWQKDIADGKDFDVAIASSPVLHDGRLYLLADRNNKKSTLTAYEPKTGERLWEVKRTTGFAHSTPTFAEHAGKSIMLVGASNELQALDPATGERIWWVKTPGDVTSPVYANGFVYSDSGRGSAGVCVDASGKGDVTASNVKWSLKSISETMSSPLVVGDHLYRLHSPGVLKCVEWKTGKVLYEERIPGVATWSSPIAASGRFYLASAGKTIVLAPGPTYEILATNDLGDPSYASGAVSANRLVLKGGKHVYCVGSAK